MQDNVQSEPEEETHDKVERIHIYISIYYMNTIKIQPLFEVNIPNVPYMDPMRTWLNVLNFVGHELFCRVVFKMKSNVDCHASLIDFQNTHFSIALAISVLGESSTMTGKSHHESV